MGILKEVTTHASCDRVGCNVVFTGRRLPQTWRFVSILTPSLDGQTQPSKKGLLCPDCASIITAQFQFKPQKQEQEESPLMREVLAPLKAIGGDRESIKADLKAKTGIS